MYVTKYLVVGLMYYMYVKEMLNAFQQLTTSHTLCVTR